MRALLATDRFTAGHIAGTGIVLFGTLAIARELVDRAQAQSLATLADVGTQTRAARRGQRWPTPGIR